LVEGANLKTAKACGGNTVGLLAIIDAVIE
jgi:hypothetical protein